MKKSSYVILLACLLSLTYAHAMDQYREFETGYPDQDTLLLFNFPYWIEANETGTIYVSNYYSDDTNYAQMQIAGGNWTNMTYVSSSNRFRAFVSSSTEEDVNFSVRVLSSVGDQLANGTGTLRFRVPFTVTMNFFKNKNTTNTDVEAYDNEFQYGVLVYHEPGVRQVSYELEVPNTNKVLNAIGGLFPYYRELETTTTTPVTQSIYLSARLDDGTAEFDLYNNGTYTLYTFNTDMYGGLTPLYEFGKPVRNGQTEFRSTVADDVVVGTESDATYSVFISAWEVYKWHVLKNFLKIVACLLAWAILVMGISYAATFWLPLDMRGQAFGICLGVFATVTSPLLILAVKLVWG